MIESICEGKRRPRIIPMDEMLPYDIGVIKTGAYGGELVMRTASICHFEVMSLSKPSDSGSCWGRDCITMVELLESGGEVKLKVK